MRVARVLLFLALSGAVAHADDAKPADPHPADAAPARTKIPLRVVRMLPETKQVLLFDKAKGTHVVVEAGQAVEGYFVDSIEDDEVTLLSDNGATVVLAAPDPVWRHRRDGERTADASKPGSKPSAAPASSPTSSAALTSSAATTSSAAPASSPTSSAPTSAAASSEPLPADPYADLAAGGELGTGADGVRVVEAPDAPAMAPTAPVLGTGADGVRVVEAPGGPAAPSPTPAPAAVPGSAPAAVTSPAPTTPSAPAPATVPHDPAGDALAAALTGSPAPTSAATSATTTTAATTSAATTGAPTTSAAGAATASDGTVQLARADVNAALASFGTLAGSIRGAFTPTGVRVDSVAAGSLFAKAGLRDGDVVSAVNGVPLRSLDDAADLYARAGTAKAVSVAIVRAGKPITLRVTIQ